MKVFTRTLIVVKVAAVFALSPVFADQEMRTNQRIPCEDVKKNKEVYGCVEDTSGHKPSYQCLEKLEKVASPMKKSNGDDTAKIFKGKKAMAVDAGDKLVLLDKDKEYKLTKEKIKQAISAKYGPGVAEKKKFEVTVQTPEGKVKLKIKKTGSGQNWNLGKIEKDDSIDTPEDKKVHIGVGLADQVTDSDGDLLSSVKNKLTEAVNKFDQNAEEAKQKIETEHREKKDAITNNQALTSNEKRKMRRKIDEEKDKKLAEIEDMKEKKAQNLASAAEKCQNDDGRKFVDSSIFSNASGADQGSRPSRNGAAANR